MKNLLCILIIFCFSNTALFAQASDLDSTFGINGVVKTLIDSASVVNSIALQTDGKIVAGGWSSINNFSNFTLSRYLPDGNLDSTFGANGVTRTYIDSSSELYSIAIQQDGKIVAGGYSQSNPSSYEPPSTGIIARYNVNGTLDSTFGQNGIFRSTTYIYFYILSIAIQPDGKIVAGGQCKNNPDSSYFGILRVQPSGLSDSSFGQNGIVMTRMSEYAYISSLSLQTDNKIVGFGSTYDNYFTLVRYDTTGNLDNAFGRNGIVQDSLSGSSGNSLQIQNDGKIVAAGTVNYSFGLIRYLTNGDRDSSFGNNGFAPRPDTLYNGFSAFNSGFISSAIQSDGKIIAGGILRTPSGGVFELARYTSYGFLDSTFGVNGQQYTVIDTSSSIHSIRIQTDGKIVAGGFCSPTGVVEPTPDYNNGTCFALARYLSDLNTGILNLPIDNNTIYIYPNPMKETETLGYTLKDNESMTISLEDMEGRTVKTFINDQQQDAGNYKQLISIPQRLPAGSYIIDLSSPNGKIGIKVIKN